MNTFWMYIASPGAALIAALFVIGMLIKRGLHRNRHGKITRKRLGKLITLTSSGYVFLICSLTLLPWEGPSLDVVISEGFGNVRVAWLIFAVLVDQCFFAWELIEQREE